jgi:hypothetical protein
MAEQEPGLRARQPWKAACERDYGCECGRGGAPRGDDTNVRVLAAGILAALEGVTVDDFEARAGAFLRGTVHPTLGRGTSSVRTRRWSSATGDIPMLDYTQHPAHPCLRLLVRQDDPEREFDYSAGAEQALSLAEARERKVVSRTQVFRPGPSA